MSQTSSPLDPRLRSLVAGLEDDDGGLRIAAAVVYALPYADIHLVVEVAVERRLNILEEFILRAAHELDPPPTLPELAAMLGLDPLFVEASWRDMTRLGAVILGEGQTLGLTPEGTEAYRQQQLPPAIVEEDVDLRYWFVTDELEANGTLPGWSSADAILPGYESLEEDQRTAALASAATDTERVISAMEASGLNLEQLDEGRSVRSVRSWSVVESGAAPVVLLAIADDDDPGGPSASYDVQALRPGSGERLARVKAAIESWLADGTVSIDELFGDAVGSALELYIPASSEAGLATALESGAGVAVPTAEPTGDRYEGERAAEDPMVRADTSGAVTNGVYWDQLPGMVTEARHTVLLCLPTRAIRRVDHALIDEMETLVARGVVVVIGVVGGLADDDADALREAPLTRRLYELASGEGSPPIVVLSADDGAGSSVVVDGVWRDLDGDGVSVSGPSPTARARVESCIATAAASRWASVVDELLDDGIDAAPIETTRSLARCCVAWAAAGAYPVALQSILGLLDAEANALPIGMHLMAVTLSALSRLEDADLQDLVDVEILREAVIDIDTRFSDVPEEQYAEARDRLDVVWRRLRRRLAAY